MERHYDPMARYADQPRMGAGSVGKCGYLRLGFELDASGRTILREWERRAPTVVQQALYFDEEWEELPCVYILSSGGPNVDGDRYRQHISLGPSASAYISTAAATKVAQMRHNYSSLNLKIELSEGAYLEYLPEPVIPCRHSRYNSHTLLTIHPEATLLYADIVLCGRKHHGESFDYDIFCASFRAFRPSGEELFAESQIHEPRRLKSALEGVMGDFDVRATAYLLTPRRFSDQIYDLTPSLCDGEVRAAITRLPNDCGVKYMVLGSESGAVKRCLREFCSSARLLIKGRPLPREFAWR